MEPITILIADDDPGMRMVMRRVVEREADYALVGEATDGEELLALYDELSPEVVLMDVEMPGKTGIECARVIQDKNPRTVLVFATAHEEYMRSAFEVYAFDYLVKPFKLERAGETLMRIKDRLRAPLPAPVAAPSPSLPPVPGRMMLKHRDGVAVLDVAQIAMVLRENRSTVIVMADGARYVVPDGMAELDERLPDELFFRTHKSYIVNLNLIDAIQPYGRWTYIVKLKGLKEDALITHERYEELQKRFA